MDATATSRVKASAAPTQPAFLGLADDSQQADVRHTLACGVTMILLDNMDIDTMSTRPSPLLSDVPREAVL